MLHSGAPSGDGMDKGKRPILYDEEDEEPIQISEVSVASANTISLCLLGKLRTERPYNMFGLFETMKKLWCPAKGMVCRDMGNNLISFQFHCKRDMERVMEMEPWHFNKHVLVLSPIREDVQPSLMNFDKTPFWIRIYDVPWAGRKDEILHQIGTRFGEVIEIDKNSTSGIARSIRIKIRLDLTKPIKRGTKLRIGSSEACWLPVTYERLPSFCYWCGMLGHTSKDCEQLNMEEDRMGKIPESQMPFGEFLKASPMKRIHSVVDKSPEIRDEIRRSLFQPRTAKLHSREGTTVNESVQRKEQGSKDDITDLLNSLQKVEVGQHTSSENTHKVALMHRANEKSVETQSLSRETQTKTTIPIPNNLQQHPAEKQQNHPPPKTLINHAQPNRPKTTQQPPLNQYTSPKHLEDNPPCHPQYPTPLPYTPTPVLINMINNLVKDNQTTKATQHHQPVPPIPPHKPIKPQFSTHTQKKPEPPPYKTYPLKHVKIEPTSPIKQQGSRQTPQGYTDKKWKRKPGSGKRIEGAGIEIGSKRKENSMDIDSANFGAVKKTKNAYDDSSIPTAETAEQSRQTL